MNYNLPGDISSRINGFLSAGYTSPEEVMREVLSALEYRDADLAAIRCGIEDEAAGRFAPARQTLAVRAKS